MMVPVSAPVFSAAGALTAMSSNRVGIAVWRNFILGNSPSGMPRSRTEARSVSSEGDDAAEGHDNGGIQRNGRSDDPRGREVGASHGRTMGLQLVIRQRQSRPKRSRSRGSVTPCSALALVAAVVAWASGPRTTGDVVQ